MTVRFERQQDLSAMMRVVRHHVNQELTDGGVRQITRPRRVVGSLEQCGSSLGHDGFDAIKVGFSVEPSRVWIVIAVQIG